MHGSGSSENVERASLAGRQRSNEAGEMDRCFFILFTIKSCTIHINEKILVVKRLRYDRVRCIVAVWLHVARLRPVA
jgi:hypothetical protein